MQCSAVGCGVMCDECYYSCKYRLLPPQFVRGREWKVNVGTFMKNKAHLWDTDSALVDDSEGKVSGHTHAQYTAYCDFSEMAEQLIGMVLSGLGTSEEAFVRACEVRVEREAKGPRDAHVQDLLLCLLQYASFPRFHLMMREHHREDAERSKWMERQAAEDLDERDKESCGWSCESCTYINPEETTMVCGVCGTGRRGGGGGGGGGGGDGGESKHAGLRGGANGGAEVSQTGWTAYEDDEGSMYYVNNVTHVSSWDRPPPGVPVDESWLSQPSTLGDSYIPLGMMPTWMDHSAANSGNNGHSSNSANGGGGVATGTSTTGSNHGNWRGDAREEKATSQPARFAGGTKAAAVDTAGASHMVQRALTRDVRLRDLNEVEALTLMPVDETRAIAVLFDRYVRRYTARRSPFVSEVMVILRLPPSPRLVPMALAPIIVYSCIPLVSNVCPPHLPFHHATRS